MIIILNIATSLNGNGKKKIFSNSIMQFRIDIKVSEGMWKYVTKHVNDNALSYCYYIRGLIMKDLKIDEYGKAKK